MSIWKGQRTEMKLLEFDFNLPESLIAQVPIEKRDESRLMVLNKTNKTIEHKIFTNILDYLKKGDCLVINNTKVIPARLLGKKCIETNNIHDTKHRGRHLRRPEHRHTSRHPRQHKCRNFTIKKNRG